MNDNNMNNKIYPKRLVFIQMSENCMFCDNPKGEAFTNYVDLPNKMGYIYCNKCEKHAEKAVEEWKDSLMYGRANYLKNREIFIKRTSGDIEKGWKLCNPFLSYDINGIARIQCCNDSFKKERWCLLDEIIDLNPI